MVYNIRYRGIGGVKKTDIPENYPLVLDQLLYPGSETSENYYPNWSRAAYMDIRNVRDLVLDNIRFSSKETDEREPYYVEECLFCRQDVEVK